MKWNLGYRVAYNFCFQTLKSNENVDRDYMSTKSSTQTRRKVSTEFSSCKMCDMVTFTALTTSSVSYFLKYSFYFCVGVKKDATTHIHLVKVS